MDGDTVALVAVNGAELEVLASGAAATPVEKGSPKGSLLHFLLRPPAGLADGLTQRREGPETLRCETPSEDSDTGGCRRLPDEFDS